MKNFRIPSRLIPLLLLVVTPPAFAQFVPGPNPITGTTGTQNLPGGTGTVNASGKVSTSGGTVGVTISGTATLNNNGTIEQTGSGRAIDNTVNNSNLTVTNTGNITSVSSDAFRVNTTNTSVNLTNSGTISVSAGGQAIDWAAITTGANSLTNQSTGVISAVGEDAIRPGTNGVIINAGTITATPTGGASPSGSDGIDLRTEKTGISVTNTGTISGRHGIATDGANVGPSSLTVNNNAGLITALNGSGINIDGVNTSVTANVTNAFGATIRGGVLAAATDGDGDGIDVDGVLTLNNSGDILGLGAKGSGNNAEGLAIGGGNITNTSTGRIIGSTLLADAPNGDVTKAGNGILVDNSSGGNAIAATTIINSGLIQGKSGNGIKIIGTFADTVTNNAGGTVRGTGTGAVIDTGDGADTVNNSGTIQHDLGGIGNIAIALGAGSDTLNVTGGSAAIIGSIDGGTGTNLMTITPGAGNTFSFAHQITNINQVTVGTGKFNLASTATLNTSVVVTSGGILAGTGTIVNNVQLQTGGMISPGSSPGTLNIGGNLFVDAGAKFQFELGPIPSASDLIAVSGFLQFAGSGTMIFDFINAGMIVGDYDLIAFSSSNLTLSNLQFGILPAGFSGNFFLDGNSVSLHVTAVPEPSSTAAVIGLMVLSGVTFLRGRNRKNQQVTA